MANKEVVDLVINAKNLATKELEKAAADVKGLGNEVAKTELELDQLKIDQDIIQSYSKLEAEVNQLDVALASSVVQLKKSRKELKANKNATEEDENAVQLQAQAVKRQNSELSKRNTQLVKSKAALQSLGIVTSKAAVSEELYAKQILDTQVRLKTLNGVQTKRIAILETAKVTEKKLTVALKESTIAAQEKAVAQEKSAIADIKSKAAQASSVKQAERYVAAITELNNELKRGNITKTQFIAKEKALRSQFKQTSAAAKGATASIELNSVATKKAARNTDGLTKVTRRLAQAYTVLIAAQSAGRAIAANVEEFGALEEAQTKVLKTTDLMKSEIISMTDELIKMSSDVTPTATNELLRYAEVAGQLGVEGSANILRMVAAADALNVSTDLAGDEAATLLTRILTMTKEGVPAIDGLASTVVALGNNTATTESEIVQMTKEIVTGAQSINLGSTAAAAFGATLKELGQRGESSRSAFTRLSNAIKLATLEGGDDLENLSRITGQTADELKKNLGDKPEKILQGFVNGLAKVREEGGSVKDVLNQFGLTSLDTLSVLESLANNNERLARNINLANEAQADGTAHLREAAKAYSTQNAALDRLNNKFKQIKTSVGEAFSDETNDSINALGDALIDNEALIVSFFEGVVDLGGELLEVGESVLSVGKSLNSLAGDGAILSGSLVLLSGFVNGLQNGFYALSLVMLQVRKGYLLVKEAVTGGNAELTKSLADLETEQNRILVEMGSNVNDFLNTVKQANGTSSQSYEDLNRVVREQADAVAQLSLQQKSQLEDIIKSGVYNKDLEKIYARLVAEITRLSRENDVYSASKERLARLDAEEIERKKLLVEADRAYADSQKFAKIQLDAVEVKIKQLAFAYKVGAISTEKFEESQRKLLKAKSQLKKGIFGILDALPKEVKSVNEVKDAYAKLSSTTLKLTKSRDKAQRAQDKANKALKDAAGLAIGTEKAKRQLEVATRDLTDAQKALNAQVELEKLNVFELNRLRADLIRQIEAETIAKKSNTGSVVENNKTLQALAEQLSEVDRLLGDAKDSTDNLSGATDRNSESNRENRITLEELIETRKKDAIAATEQFNASIKAGKAASAAASASFEINDANALASKSVEELNSRYELLSSTFAGVTTQIGNLSKSGRQIDGFLRRQKEFELGYIRQARAVTLLEDKLKSTNLTLAELDKISSQVNQGFDLLGDDKLDPLRSSIESARREFEALDASIDNSLARTQDRLDKLLGNEQAILDRRFQSEIDAATTQLKEAKSIGDKEAVATANENISKLKQIHDIEQANFKARQKQKEEDNKVKNNKNSTPDSLAKDPVDNNGNPVFDRQISKNETVTIKFETPRGVSEVTLVDDGSKDTLIDVLTEIGNNNITSVE